MKAKVDVLSIAALSLLVSGACCATERETRPVSDFDAIEVGGSVELHVQQGSTFHVEVESIGWPASHLVTEVRGSTLELHHDWSWASPFRGWGRHRDIVRVTLPHLTALRASGGSDVRGEGTLTGERLDIRASGGADVKLDVAVATLDVRSSGGSDLRLSGSAGTTILASSGGSDLDASRLKTGNARVSSSGGADVSIGESETLVASASGGSDIAYAGEPRSLTVNKSGGGDVARR